MRRPHPVDPNELLLRTESEVKKVISVHGFRHFLLSYSPTGGHTGLRNNVICSNWPDQLLTMCDDADLLSHIAMNARVRRNLAPQFIDIRALVQLNFPKDRDTTQAFESLLNVIVFHMRDLEGSGYLFFLSNALEIGEASLGVLTLGLLRAVEAIKTIKQQPKPRLSAREIDCLKWSAAGKSSDEIGGILNLSEYTVNGYLKAAIKKLNAVNRTQAVAKACKLEII